MSAELHSVLRFARLNTAKKIKYNNYYAPGTIVEYSRAHAMLESMVLQRPNRV